MLITDFLQNFNGGTRVNRFVVSTDTSSIGPLADTNINGTDGAGSGKSSATFNQQNSQNGPGKFNFPIHIRAAKIPDLTMGVIPVNYRGKTVYFPGDRALSDWEIIVIDDVHSPGGGGGNVPDKQNMHLHRAFMDWSHAISPIDSSLGVNDIAGATRWTSSQHGNVWKISQYDTWPITGKGTTTHPTVVRTFKMYNCWPKEIGPLQFSMDSNNTVNYFMVKMAYTHTQAFDTTNGAVDW